jgi:hypothetical protein
MPRNNCLYVRRAIVDMITFTRESELNRRAYEQLRDFIRREYAGKYVALANGNVIGVASTFDDARKMVEGMDVVPEYYLVFPASQEPHFDLVDDFGGSI